MIPAQIGPDMILAARRWAQAHDRSVGLISIETAALRVLHIDGRTPPDLLPAVPFQDQGMPDVQLARRLYAMRPAITQWLVIPLAPDHALTQQLRSAVDEYVLFCGIQNENLISAYRALKAFRADENDIAGVRLLIAAPTASQAEHAHQRLNGVATEFLHQELAMEHVAPGPLAPIGAVTEIPLGALAPDQVAALGATIEEFFRDVGPEPATLSEETPDSTADLPPEVVTALYPPAPTPPTADTVLNWEERAALAAPVLCHDSPTPPPAAIAESPAIPAAPAMPVAPVAPVAQLRPVAPPSPSPTTAPQDHDLHVIDTTGELTLAAQWQAIEQSIPGLMNSATVLDARPPWGSAALAVDAAHHLHLWVLATPDSPLAWPALQAWANTHRSLIALTRRDLPINTAAPVQVHIVLPAATPPAPGLPPATDITWYRLHKIHWSGRTGLTVVPC